MRRIMDFGTRKRILGLIQLMRGKQAHVGHRPAGFARVSEARRSAVLRVRFRRRAQIR